jgi:hypothetical protein
MIIAILGPDIVLDAAGTVVADVGAEVEARDVDGCLEELDVDLLDLVDDGELLKTFEMMLDRFFSTGVLDIHLQRYDPIYRIIYTSRQHVSSGLSKFLSAAQGE